MSVSPNVFQRVGSAVSGFFSGGRLTHRAIVSGIEAEAVALQRVGRPEPVVETPQLLTAFASSFAAIWTLPRVISREAKSREALRARLAAAKGTYVKTVTASRMLLTLIDWPELRAEHEKVVGVERTARTVLRSHHLPAAFYYLTLVMVAVVDFQFFYSLLMDVQVASPKSAGYLLVVIQSAGVALMTPIAVIVIGEWGGRRFARLRSEVREWLDARSAGVGGEPARRLDGWSVAGELVTPVAILVCLGSLMLLFYSFATHRFTALLANPGAIKVDAHLLALLIALLPLVAFLASAFHHDLPTKHRKLVLAAWDGVQRQISANQVAVNNAMDVWEGAWDALAAKVAQMVAEGKISVQTWEHLVLMGLARINQRGLTAYTLTSVMAPVLEAAGGADRLAGVATRYLPVVVPARQMATKFASAEWVLDELETDLQALIRYQPTPDGATDADIQRLLTFAGPAAVGVPADAPAVEADGETAAEPVEPVEFVESGEEELSAADTVYLERLLDEPPADN